MRVCPWCGKEPEMVLDGQTSEVFCANPACVVRPTTGKLRKDAAYPIWNNQVGLSEVYKENNLLRLELSKLMGELREQSGKHED